MLVRMTVAKLQPHQLPHWPRLLAQPLAAAYVGISEGLFCVGVNSGLWPQPLTIHSRKVWDRAALDRRVDAIGHAPLVTDAETRKRQYQEKQAARASAKQRAQHTNTVTNRG